MKNIRLRDNYIHCYRLFGRWLLALAGFVLLLGTGISARADGDFTCTAQSPTPLIRAEGFTEQVGNIIITCTGGTPTPVGSTIPTSNFRIGLNTNITSRINPVDGAATGNVDGPPSEALLILDNAYEAATNPPSTPPANAPPFSLCPSVNGCNANATGSTGVSPYTGGPGTGGVSIPGGTASFATTNGYSAYQGVYVANPGGDDANSEFDGIDFVGVPVDAPGANQSRVIRIANIRADAVGRLNTAGGVGTIPVIAYISVSGAMASVPITNSEPTVGYVVSGISFDSTSQSYTQCTSPSGSPGITVSEGFAYAFEPRIWSDFSNVVSGVADDTTGSTPLLQNLPGFGYFTESGFTPNSTTAGSIGAADSGTRFIVRLSNLQQGVSVTVPGTINGTGSLVLYLVTGADAYGAGGTLSPQTGTTITGSYAGGATATSNYIVYEVVKASGMTNESFHIPFNVAYTSNVAGNVPYVTPHGVTDLLTPTNGYSQASVSFAPSAPASITNPATGPAWNLPNGPYTNSDYQWMPRFTESTPLTNFIGVQACALSLPDPVVQTISAPAAAPEGSVVPVSVTITNQGNATVSALYMSRVGISVYYDAALTQPVPNAQPQSCSVTPLSAGASATCNENLLIPADLNPGAASATWYIGVSFGESSCSGNVCNAVARLITASRPITVDGCQYSISPSTVNAGPTGGDFMVRITAGASCPPPSITVGDPDWVTVESVTANSAEFKVAEGNATRSETITVGTASLQINQDEPSPAMRFVPVTPCRVADTRNAAGPEGGPSLTGGIARNFAIGGSACGIPATAQAYSLNVTVVPHGDLNFLTVWPSRQVQPMVSTMSSPDGRIRGNSIIVPAGANGAVSVYATDTTDLVLDINGYFTAADNTAALAFYPLAPCRVADTRNPSGMLGGPYLSGGSTRDFPVLSSACNIPASARAYSLNFAAVPHGELGYITAWPASQSMPLAATLSALTGTVTANAAVVPAGPGGDIDVFASNDTDLVIDIDGYFAPPGPGGLSLHVLPACRVLDTRSASGTPPAGGTEVVNLTAGYCGVPTNLRAAILNATVLPSGPLGYLTLWPNGAPQPLTATLNALDGVTTSNMALVPTTNGSIDAFTTNPTNLLLDIYGWFGE